MELAPTYRGLLRRPYVKVSSSFINLAIDKSSESISALTVIINSLKQDTTFKTEGPS